MRHWRAEAETHWQLGLYSSGHHRQSHWPVYICKDKGTSLRTGYCDLDTTGSFQNHFRHTKTRSFQSHILLRGRQHKFSVFVQCRVTHVIKHLIGCHTLNVIEIDLQLYKIYKITRVSFFWDRVYNNCPIQLFTSFCVASQYRHIIISVN